MTNKNKPNTKKKTNIIFNKIIPDKILPDNTNNSGNKPHKTFRTQFKKWIILTILGIVFAVLGVLAILWVWGRELPDYTSLKSYEPPVSSRVFAGDGRLITQYSHERRVFMPIESIPTSLKNAFIAAEDKNFYSHSGVDSIALSRAIFNNIIRIIKGERLVGASTITQQVSRHFFLSKERTYTRKIKEAILALRIEKVLSKDRILELYLNQIYLGRGSYGIAAASMRYFNKSPEKLNLAEMAYLAALPKAPNNYHPIHEKKRAIGRRNWVLIRMYQENYISAIELAKNKNLPLDAMRGKELQTIDANYFLEETRRVTASRFGNKKLYEDGLSIHTTLRSDYQKYAYEALRSALIAYDRRHGYRGAIVNLSAFNDAIKRFKRIPAMAGTKGWIQGYVSSVKTQSAIITLKDDTEITLPFKAVKWARKYYKRRPGHVPKKMADVLTVGDVILLEEKNNLYLLRQVPLINGAIVAMDPHTGKVMAMVGGWDFNTSKFNRATQAHRQPGSSVKPFVYLTALNNGITPATMVLDAPFVLTMENGKKWKPNNFSKKFFGPSILRIGIEKSRNLMTIRLAQQVGIEKVAANFKKFGIMKNPKPYLSLALGAGETTLLNLLNGYSMIVNGGKKITSSLIDRVQNRHGKVIYKHNERSCNDCSVLTDTMPIIEDTREIITNPINAYQVITMMEGVVKRGTGKALRSLGIPLAGKTGTTNDGKDAWFIGMTPDLIVGAYLGFDSPISLGKQPPTEKYNWWRQETGASVAVPAVKAFYELIKDQLEKVPFRIPEGVRFVRIDPKTGGLANSKTKHPQTEAFIPGTEPTSSKGDLISGSNTDPENIGLDDVY